MREIHPLTRGIIAILILLNLAIFSADSVRGGEASGGGWGMGSMIAYTHAYIQKVRPKFPGRVERLRKQIEVNLQLDYKIDIEKEPHKTMYEEAVTGKMPSGKAFSFLQDVLKDMDRVSRPIFRAEQKAVRLWKKDAKVWGTASMIPKENTPPDGEEYRQGMVFGTMIEARNLGVLLDVSPSMGPYLARVGNEIKEKFPQATLIASEGSFILDQDDNPNRWWWAEPPGGVNPFLEDFYHQPIEVGEPYQKVWDACRDAGSALLAMVELGGFDAIYWFTDFDDPMAGLNQLCDRLAESGVKIYIQPQNARTPSRLARVVKNSGGAVISTRGMDLTASQSSGSTDDSMARKRFEVARKNMVDEPHARAIALVEAKYIKALEKALAEADKRGDDDTTKALRREVESFRSHGITREKAPTNPELIRLRKIYQSLVEAEEKTRSINIAKLEKLFPDMKYIEQVSPKKPTVKTTPVTAAPSKKTDNEETESSDGLLAIVGTFDGKPVELAERFQTMEIAWTKSIDTQVFFGNEKDGMFVLEKNGVRPVNAKNGRYWAKNHGWRNTILTYGGALDWKMHPEKKSGTIDGVAEFYSSGNAEKGSLLALKNSGDLELLHYGIEMDWDFAAWASNHTFKDIALSRFAGIEAAALALTDSGKLYAFNNRGFHNIPEVMSRGVASVSCGEMFVHFGVVKKDGEVFEFVRGKTEAFPNDSYLAKWQKVSPAILKGRKAINFECGTIARAIQFEDKTWEVYRGRNAYGERIFREITDAGPLKELRVIHADKRGKIFAVAIK